MSPNEEYLYVLAERLSMTVTRLKQEMGFREYLGWIQLDNRRHERKLHKGNNLLDDGVDIVKGFGI